MKNATKKTPATPATKGKKTATPAKGKSKVFGSDGQTILTPTKGKGKGKTPATPATPATKGKGKKTPATPTPATTPTPRVTKKGEAMELLKKGVTLQSLMDKFGWQRHTVRGFISILGKTHKIESTEVEGARTYKIA